MELEKPFLDRLRRFLGQNDGKDVPRTDEQLAIAIAIVGAPYERKETKKSDSDTKVSPVESVLGPQRPSLDQFDRI